MIKFLSVFFCIIILSGCNPKTSEKSCDYLSEITVLKTGKSDSIIIESQNRTILIDTANRDSARKITRYLGEKGIKTLDLVIITHFDKDHIGGFPVISDRIEVRNVIQPSYKTNTETYSKYVEKLGEKKINVINAKKDVSFSVNDMDFIIYTPNTEYEEENNMSLMTAVFHGNNKLLFSGDIETERSNEIMQNDIGNYNFIKIPHHGIYFEGAEEFYKAVKPEIAVITDDEKTNSEKTKEILRSLGTAVYHTKNGILKFISDGNSLKMN